MTGTITISGQLSGVEYIYSIDAGVSFQANPVFSNVASGSYLVIVNTDIGCQFSEAVVLNSPNCDGGGMSAEIFGNGIDDDGDGLIDCEDPDGGTTNLTISTQDITCDGPMTGSITIGGQLAGVSYTYSINDGLTFQPSPTFTGLAAGSYNIVVRTADGCEYIDFTALATPICDNGPTAEICDNGIDDDGDGLTDCDDPDCGIAELAVEVEQITCTGDMTGSITVTGQVTGINYQYSLDAGQSSQTSATFSGLIAGDYTVSVSTGPGSNCTFTQAVTLESPNCDGGGMSAEIFGNGIDDDGDGLIDCADPDGGTTNLTITTQDITCDGPMTGSIAIGGQAAGVFYTYSNDNGQTFQSSSIFTNLVAGSYNVVVRTADGCEYTDVAVLTTPNCDNGPTSEICDNGLDDDGDGLTDCADPDCGISELSIAVGQVTCDGPMTGSITITGQQAGTTYNYSIDNGASFQVSSTFADLATGDYNVLVETAGGCQFTQQITLEEPVCTPGPEICDNGIDDDGDGLTDCDDPDCGVSSSDIMINTTDATCDMDDGSISVSSTTIEEFSYSIDGGLTTQEGLSALFQGLAPTTGSGTQSYSLIATNAFGCSITTEVDIDQEMCVDICDTFMAESPTIVESSCPDNNDGAIIFDAPSVGFSFSLDGQIFVPFGLFTNLDSGQYTLFVQNADGCIDEVPVTVPGMECQMASETFSSDVFELRVILEGPYEEDQGLMTTMLNDLGYLPGQRPTTFFGEPVPSGQPYNQSPWFYDGDEGVGVSERDLYDDTVVDWVLVSLRATELRPSTFWRGAGLLHEDGSIEMIQEPNLADIEDREFFVLIEHRNHLPVMSPNPLRVRGGQLTYDFSQSDSFKQIIGIGQKELSNGVYVMPAGNGDIDTEISSIIDINVRDLNVWAGMNGANSSYFIEDYDLNGDINIRDRELWQENNGVFSTISYR
jgi:hypothetical protein